LQCLKTKKKKGDWTVAADCTSANADWTADCAADWIVATTDWIVVTADCAADWTDAATNWTAAAAD